MVNKTRPDSLQSPNELEDIQNELPKIVEGHEETGDAIQRCVEVCGPFRSKKMKKKRMSKATEAEKKEEEPKEVKPVDPIEEKKKELLKEMSTVGLGQVAKIRNLLKRIEALNEESFRANLAAPMARHELMTLLAEQGVRLPLWVSSVGEHPPPLVGAIGANDAYKLVVGDYCAAYCEDMWILGEVHGIADNGRYEIRDVDDREKPFTILARRRVIPLPRYRADPQRDSFAIFPKNAWILALYPQTTVFYKGIIDEPPLKATDPYKISFDDSTFHGGFSPPLEVPQRYVLSFRDVTYKPRGDGGKTEEKTERVKVREPTKEELKEQKEMEKEKMREQRELERERKKEKKAEEKRMEKLRKKEAKKTEKERIKREIKEAKQKEKEIRRKERRKEKNLIAKERYARRKQEERERKEAEARGEGVAEGVAKANKDGEEKNEEEEDEEKKEEEDEVDDEEVEEEEEEEDEEEEEEDKEEEEEEEKEDDEDEVESSEDEM